VQNLVQELQRRNVFRVGIAYLALAWLVIQITDVAVPALKLPEVLHSIVFYIGLVGFPFALFFAWAFELTPGGIKRSEEVEEQDSIRPATGRSLERVALLFAVGALVFVVWDAYLEPKPAATPVAEPVATEAPIQEAIRPKEPKSIAVLPFVNMSDDKDYFADGLSEELLNLLAKIPGLQVTGRTSSFAFKGKNIDLREVGSTLGVSTILEGSVRRAGNTIRVTAQLINVEDGFHIWSQTYDRDMTDIFAIQDEIAGHITRSLEIHLDAGSGRSELPTDNLEAYALYLEAKPRIGIPDQLHEAEEMLNRATALDPDFVEAWIDLDQVVHNQSAYGLRSKTDIAPLTEHYHQMMYTLAPDHPATITTRGGLQSLKEKWGWAHFFDFLRGAIEDHPEYSRSYDWLSHTSLRLGQYKQVIEVTDALAERDPLFFEIGSERGMALFSLGRDAESQETLVRFGDTVGFSHIRTSLALINLRLGDPDTADKLLREYSEGRAVEPGELQQMLEALMDPARREATLDSDLWREHFAMPAASVERNRGLAYIFLNDPKFWPVFQQIAESGEIDSQLLTFLMGTYRLHDLMETDEYRQLAEASGFDDYWREESPPDFCALGHQSWTCEL
jgi:TolB-like protein